MKIVRRRPPSNETHLPALPARAIEPLRPENAAFNPEMLAYEDVVTLATRLMGKGYAEIGADFMSFANSPTGLASLYRLHARNRGTRSAASLKLMLAAVPFASAATFLLKSKNLERHEVAKAVLMIELGKADPSFLPEEPPQFTD